MNQKQIIYVYGESGSGKMFMITELIKRLNNGHADLLQFQKQQGYYLRNPETKQSRLIGVVKFFPYSHTYYQFNKLLSNPTIKVKTTLNSRCRILDIANDYVFIMIHTLYSPKELKQKFKDYNKFDISKINIIHMNNLNAEIIQCDEYIKNIVETIDLNKLKDK